MRELFPAETVKLSIGEIPIAFRRDQPPFVWKLSYGVQPYTVVLDTTFERADKIFDLADRQFEDGRTRTRNDQVGPLTIKASEPGFPDFECKGVYVSQTTPTSDRINRKALILTDRRVLFDRTIVERAYNVPRGSGEAVIRSDSNVPVQLRQISEDRIYRSGSLKPDGSKWTAREVLEDVLLEVCGEGQYVFDVEPTFTDSVEGLLLHRMSGSAALQVVLGYLPGVQIYVGLDGLVHVTNCYGKGGETQALRADTERAGGWEIVDRALLRPRRVRVYFEQECELRFTYTTTSGFSTTRGREDLAVENVIQVTDPQLTLADGTVVTAGSWITFPQAYAAWNADSANPVPFPGIVVSDTLIRRMYMEGLGTLSHIFQVATVGGINAIWAARLQAVEQHWRRTFRVLPQWVDKLRRLSNVRVAIIDEERGTRAQAQAWFNYSVRPTTSGLALGPSDAQGWHVTDCYAENLNDSSGPGPAEVRMLNPDAGIFQLVLRKDVYGRGAQIAPGTLNDNGFPVWNVGDAYVAWSKATLDTAWSMSTILTGVQDVPNNEKRLLAVTVEANEAAESLGADIGFAQQGPDYEVYGSVETARYAWSDDFADQIREAFYSGGTIPEDLMVNPETVKAVARGQAARIYVALEDRAEGMFTARFNPSIIPSGSLSQVNHVIGLQGCSTQLVMPPLVQAPALMALLPASVRAILKREVQR